MRSERGFALIAALWLLVILSAVGLEFGLRARARRLAAANVLESSRAVAAAEAGIAAAHAELADLIAASGRAGSMDADRRLDPWATWATLPADTISLGDARFHVTLSDPAARLNLNRADEQELRRLFVALRIDAGVADRMAQAIADWRDPDELTRGRGAERPDYLRAGALVLPANAPFESPAELRYVKGVTPELYDRVRGSLTVVGTGRINLNTASRPVLLALPGMSEQAATVLLRRRTSRRPVRSLEDLARDLSTGPREALVDATGRLLPCVVFETRELFASSEGWTIGSPVRGRVDALFARAGDATFLVWRRVW
ncbi:MAG TPA: type II secretion system protein GspK [Gemmatimonadales bacterium]